MTKRTLKTTKILAVALTAVTGCVEAPSVGRTSEPPILPEPVSVTAAPVVVASAAEPVAPVEVGAASTKPAARMSEDPVLIQKADEIAAMGHVQAIAQMKRFRPVCDKDGFPLVGNVMRKGPSPREEVKSFCAEVRRREGGHG